jgi:hypothetical protein
MERKTLQARDGMILTNGEIYGTQIYLAEGVDASAFYEITREEYEAILKLQEIERLNL